jgi:hypothetical protein
MSCPTSQHILVPAAHYVVAKKDACIGWTATVLLALDSARQLLTILMHKQVQGLPATAEVNAYNLGHPHTQCMQHG